MARLVLCALVLLAAGGLAEPAKKVLPQKIADPAFLSKQVELLFFFYHPHEPVFVQQHKEIAATWDIVKNIDQYSNATAVKIYNEWTAEGFLPKGVPFSILVPAQRFETLTLFNVLYSAKDYSTFYKTAAYLKSFINEGLFIYVLSAAILHRPDTQGIYIPPIYEIFPSFFNNGEIMTTAQRINTQGKHLVEYYPSTYINNNDVIIKWNETVWPYYENDVSYFTQDHSLNAFYYNYHLGFPKWFGAEMKPLVKDYRGEWFFFVHRQILARYYMERLSNGLGEIPELGTEVVQQGFTSGLLYFNGIPFPARPNHFHLDQPEFVDELTKISDFESRIREAIESGFYVNKAGEAVNLRDNPHGIDVLGRLIEADVDSPNTGYYKDFISVWKYVLGSSYTTGQTYYAKDHLPLVVPSVLENYQTALRDPAFYMIFKRVMKLYTLWQKTFPLYRPKELALPSVVIEKVEVDKLVTYFENTYVNVTNHLYMNEFERSAVADDTTVLVQRRQLNHKPFQIRVQVKSDAAKPVTVRFFLAPKYDSHGYEIPLHLNSENVFLLDEFKYELSAGETVIKRDSTENVFTVNDWPSAHDVYLKAENALKGNGQFVLDQTYNFLGFPQRLLLPKGRVGGMAFKLVVAISDFKAPETPYGTGFDPAVSLGFGTGATRYNSDPLFYPFDRPLYDFIIRSSKNIVVNDVTIYHKPTPEIVVPFAEY